MNIAWIELAYDVVTMVSPAQQLGWPVPVIGWSMSAHQWFWTHFALVGVTTAVLIYTYHVWPVANFERNDGDHP